MESIIEVWKYGYENDEYKMTIAKNNIDIRLYVNISDLIKLGFRKYCETYIWETENKKGYFCVEPEKAFIEMPFSYCFSDNYPGVYQHSIDTGYLYVNNTLENIKKIINLFDVMNKFEFVKLSNFI